MQVDRSLILGAWQGRIAGCQLGKPVELLSMLEGRDALTRYLGDSGALPLRDFVDRLERAEPDDDINYTVLALELLEHHGAAMTTEDVARAWITQLPFGAVFTAEREAYRVLAEKAHPFFSTGRAAGFDLDECSDNPFSDWIGAQIRADLYGWVCPGDPTEAARLATVDAALSHRGDGVDGARFVAACGAAIPVADDLDDAVLRAREELAPSGRAVAAVDLGRSLVGVDDAVDRLHAHFADLSPVHTLNNLALVVWSLLAHADDFGAAIGEVVAAGWDTDCNGATVGGLWGLTGDPIPAAWTEPWGGRVGVGLAGQSPVRLEDLVDRTVAVADRLVSARSAGS